jgi:transaldolase/glucose-6-phosphate isomerase
MNKSKKLHQLDQSIWLDNIDRNLIKNGWLRDQIEKEVIFGLTSNPSIFKNAITNGNGYSMDIQSMSWAGLDTKLIYEHLVIEDIRCVSDLLYPTYEATKQVDGYVSLEVDPIYADHPELTIKEAKRLWELVDRKNLMIKVPATLAGIPAIKELTASGMNVNVTLIFSVNRYLEVIDAYYSGLEERIKNNLPISQIHSVASFFVSRLDVKIESKIAKIIQSGKVNENEVQPYLGKIGILNALYAYEEFDTSRHIERFKKIAEKGGNIQRPLWASTSTKNANYSDVLYIEGLLLPYTVNTVPPKTLTAFLDHGKCDVVDYLSGKSKFEIIENKLENFGVNFEEVWIELEEEGVSAFLSAQKDLLEAINKQHDYFQRSLGGLGAQIEKRLEILKRGNFSTKFFAPDAALWTTEPSEVDEVLHRLGWIDAPILSRAIIDEADDLLKELKKDGFTHALVLGMGGSSLAPEVFSKVFRDGKTSGERGLDLSILDSTDPIQIDEKIHEIPIEKTLFIISSKSGTTAEVKALLAYFWKLVKEVDEHSPGEHFIMITDPGTPLEKLGLERNFRRVFNADPNVGGRYSALTAFGIIPAVLAGIDGNRLLDAADHMRIKCSQSSPIEKNPGFALGSVIAEAYFNNRDKVTILTDPIYSAFGSWLEQLIAESSGKSGKGILPIDREPIVPAVNYSKDRVFYYLRNSGKLDGLVDALVDLDHPVIVSYLDDTFNIAAEIYKWEIAIAAACSFIQVNPFNQPNVQESKSITHGMISEYKQNPILEERNLIFSNSGYSVYGNMEIEKKEKTIKEITKEFFSTKN